MLKKVLHSSIFVLTPIGIQVYAFRRIGGMHWMPIFLSSWLYMVVFWLITPLLHRCDKNQRDRINENEVDLTMDRWEKAESKGVKFRWQVSVAHVTVYTHRVLLIAYWCLFESITPSTSSKNIFCANKEIVFVCNTEIIKVRQTTISNSIMDRYTQRLDSSRLALLVLGIACWCSKLHMAWEAWVRWGTLYITDSGIAGVWMLWYSVGWCVVVCTHTPWCGQCGLYMWWGGW